jgi:hypothetical protein
MDRKGLLLGAAAALVPACALAALLVGCPRRPRVDPTWTPQRLRDQLERAGLVYDAQAVRDGLVLKSRDSRLSWDDARETVLTVSTRTRLPRGLLLVTVRDPALDLVFDEEGALVLHALYLRGHPDDLRAIASAVAP